MKCLVKCVGGWGTPHCACYIPENGLNGLVASTFFLLQILHLWRTPNGCNSVNCPEAQLLAGPPEKWQDMGGQMYKIESIGKLKGSKKGVFMNTKVRFKEEIQGFYQHV